jgi:hypothetical protein
MDRKRTRQEYESDDSLSSSPRSKSRSEDERSHTPVDSTEAIETVVARYNNLADSPVLVVDPLVPRTEKGLIRPDQLSQVNPLQWDELRYVIPNELLDSAIKYLPWETVLHLEQDRDFLKKNGLQPDYLILSEAMRRGLEEEFFARCSTLKVAFEENLRDAYCGNSERIISHIKSILESSITPEYWVKEAILAKNIAHTQLELDKYAQWDMDEDYRIEYRLNLEAYAVVSGCPELLFIAPLDKDAMEISSLRDAIAGGNKAMVACVLKRLPSDVTYDEDVVYEILPSFEKHDDASILNLVLRAWNLEVTPLIVKRAIKCGLVRCLAALLGKYPPLTEEQVRHFESKIRYARTFPVLQNFSQWPLTLKSTEMNADDIWYFLDWIQTSEEIDMDRVRMFHALMTHATGDSEFYRLRFQILDFMDDAV